MWLRETIKKMFKYRTITFEKLAAKWLEYKKYSVKVSTYSKYYYTINKYLNPEFKSKSLSRLKYYDFNKYVEKLKEKLAPKTVRDIISILKAILVFAEEEYGFTYKKKKIIAPKLKTQNLVILSKKEKTNLEKACIEDNTLTSLGIVVTMNTGMRVGEICALKWKNIDLEKRELKIKNTLQRIYDGEKKSTKVIIDTPKTQTSVRTIPISNKIYEILKPLKKNNKEEDFFLTGSSEAYIEPRRLQNIFREKLKKCELRRYKFHILRHTFATECIEVGMDVKSLSEILGHTNVEITLNRYVHSSYKTKKKYLERL